MTVCIAALTADDHIVTVSDHMLSMGGGAFTAESAALKDRTLHADWTALYAGDDVGAVPALIRRVMHELDTWRDEVRADKMADALTKSYQAERLKRAEELYLSPNNTTLEELYTNGPKKFGETGAAILRERIEQHKLKVELLVAGFDGNPDKPGMRTAHILHVDDPGIVKEYDMPGYWAIGSGAYLALSALARRRHSFLYLTSSAVCHVLEAKFVAESASGVGKETFCQISKPDRAWKTLDDGDLAAVRRHWEEVGQPPDLEPAVVGVQKWLRDVSGWTNRVTHETTPSASQMSDSSSSPTGGAPEQKDQKTSGG